MVRLPGGIRPRKRLDQYFLTDDRVLRREVDLAKLARSDVVLEIGAGNGCLTRMIAERAKRVIAVEKDPRFVAFLSQNCPDNVDLLEGDALDLDFPRFNKAMGNPPYSISSPLIFKLLQHPFKLGVFTFQYEFAQRMVAQPGTDDYSRLSVMLALTTRRISLEMMVPRWAFSPVPEVDSAVVTFVPRNAPRPDAASAQIIRMLFCHKRKTLANAIRDSNGELRRLWGIGSSEVLGAIQTDWSIRVYQMTPKGIMAFSGELKELATSRP